MIDKVDKLDKAIDLRQKLKRYYAERARVEEIRADYERNALNLEGVKLYSRLHTSKYLSSEFIDVSFVLYTYIDNLNKKIGDLEHELNALILEDEPKIKKRWWQI